MKKLYHFIIAICLGLSACGGASLDFSADVINSSELASASAENLQFYVHVVHYNAEAEADVEVIVETEDGDAQVSFDQGETVEVGPGNDQGVASYEGLDEDYEFHDPLLALFFEANIGASIPKTEGEELYWLRYTDSDNRQTTTWCVGGDVSEILTPAANAELSDSTEVTWDPEGMDDVTITVIWENSEGEQESVSHEVPNTGSYELDLSGIEGSGSIKLRNSTSCSGGDDFAESTFTVTSIAEVAIADFAAE